MVGCVWSCVASAVVAESQAAPPPPVAAPIGEPPPAATTVSPEPAPVPEPEPEPEEFPKKLTVGTEGYFQPGVLLQAWFRIARSDATASTFQMRRAEMHAKGEIIPKLVSYAVMIDAAKVLEFQDTDLDVEGSDSETPGTVTAKQPVSAVSVFQDLFITFQSAYLDASIGQFKIPVSYEGYNSSSKLLFAERAPVSRQYGDKRDMGLRLAKTFEFFGYSAGLFNGTTLNNLDNNNAKDAALRLEAYPIPGLLVGGVIYGSIGAQEGGTTRERYEGDLRFEKGPFIFQGEYIWGRDDSNSGGDDRGHGFYAAVAFTFVEILQPVVRGGYLDRNTEEDGASLWHLDIGVNYYILKNEAKLQLDFFHTDNEDSANDDTVILAAQVGF